MAAASQGCRCTTVIEAWSQLWNRPGFGLVWFSSKDKHVKFGS